MPHDLTIPRSRRAFLRGATAVAAGAAGVAVAGCGSDATAPTTSPTTGAASPAPAPTEVTTPVGAAGPRAWTQVLPSGDRPGPRRDHSLTLAGDAVYLFGGRLKGGSLNDLWRFDPVRSSWSEVAAENAPPERFAHNAVWDAARSRLVVFMGQGTGGALFNDVWAFDPVTSGWTEISGASSARPDLRYGAGGAHDVAGGRLLMSHGFTDSGRFDDTWAFDLATGLWSKVATTGTLPIRRCLLRTLWLPETKRMLLFGGQTDSTPFLGDLWSLDPATGAWTELTPAPAPGPRNLYGAVEDPTTKRWYVVSGNTPDGPDSATWAYDLASGEWSAGDDSRSSSMLPPRYSADAVIAGRSLYVYGGNDGKTEVGDMWMRPL